MLKKLFLFNRLKQGKDLRDFILIEQSETHYPLCGIKYSEDVYDIGRMTLTKEITQPFEVFGFDEFLNFWKKYLCPLHFHNLFIQLFPLLALWPCPEESFPGENVSFQLLQNRIPRRNRNNRYISSCLQLLYRFLLT